MATPCEVMSETKRILKAHYCHFLALSLVFLFPIALSFYALPILHLLITKSATNATEILIRYTPHQYHIGLETLSISLLYSFIVYTLVLSATGTITYSVYQGFLGRPLNFKSSIKSLSNSLLRLFITDLCYLIFILAVLFLAGFVRYILIRSIEVLGFQFLYTLPYFTIVYLMCWMILGLGFMYLQVNSVLAYVIVVVESSWGFEPLRRSWYLVKGMRGVAVFLILFYGWLMPVILLYSIKSIRWGFSVFENAFSVFEIVFLSLLVTVLLLNTVASITVLYMYCKALHGELELEKIKEEYVSLLFDGEKVPHVVSVVQPFYLIEDVCSVQKV